MTRDEFDYDYAIAPGYRGISDRHTLELVNNTAYDIVKDRRNATYDDGAEIDNLVDHVIDTLEKYGTKVHPAVQS